MQKEIELKDYLVNKYLDYSYPTSAGDHSGANPVTAANREVYCGGVGGRSTATANQRESSSEMSRHSSSVYGSQPFPHGPKYHSAPPTPLDTINSSYDDFDSPVMQPVIDSNRQSQPITSAIRRHNSSKHFDPNQNTKRTPSLSFWSQRSSPVSKEGSTMNKLTDLFKGTFKF